VLDVGCGTGATTLAAARRMGAKGRGTGIDISAPMIEVARARAASANVAAKFICADAQDFAFEPASFDLMISRFGVMFFEDPVRAFANLRRAAAPGAEIRFIAWRSPAENPFMTAAERAAAPLLPELPPRRPDAPGQFAFANRDRVQRIVEQSGWTGVDIRPLDVPCAMTLEDLERYLTRLGPVGAALQQADEITRAKVIDAVRAGFKPYIVDDEVRFVSACWMIVARAPGG
jgi:SAM-dependent methyltransferase